MPRLLSSKLFLIGLITLLLLIPIEQIRDVVRERIYHHSLARDAVAESWTGEQHLIGPLLVLPYQQEYEERVWSKTDEVYLPTKRTRDGRLLLLPETLQVEGQVQTEERARGLYRIPVYTADLKLSGHFDTRQARELATALQGQITWGRPYLSVLVGDLRGVIKQPSLDWNKQAIDFESGPGLENAGLGMHATLPPLDLSAPQSLAFHLPLLLRGMQSLAFAPVGRDTQVQLDSPWPHPSFNGRYLPTAYEVADTGFHAQWYASAFSSGMADKATLCAEGNCEALLHNSFGVSLDQSVDIYQQSERASKYALLFLTLTFALFFFYEVITRLALHPIQYLLVGLALSIFFLLLVALSEHVSFALAYTLAGGACTLLLGGYVSAVVSDRRRGALFSLIMALLYTLLYFILRSEDNALLMGTLLLFAALAGAMLATRKVDWYALRGTTPTNADAPSTRATPPTQSQV